VTRSAISRPSKIVSFVSRCTTPEQVAIICTGTCDAVAAGAGRFLQPGGQLVSAVEKLRELRFSIR
jgi:2-keto-4-pentenoate hydratase/2-oxohepta-3-ene-1,7-dioic acid hydratase in catechol pathway